MGALQGSQGALSGLGASGAAPFPTSTGQLRGTPGKCMLCCSWRGGCSSMDGGLCLMGFLHPPFPNCLHIAKLCVWTLSPPSSFAFDCLAFQEKASEFNVGLFQDLARLTKFSGSRPLAGSPALIPCLMTSPLSWEEERGPFQQNNEFNGAVTVHFLNAQYGGQQTLGGGGTEQLCMPGRAKSLHYPSRFFDQLPCLPLPTLQPPLPHKPKDHRCLPQFLTERARTGRRRETKRV